MAIKYRVRNKVNPLQPEAPKKHYAIAIHPETVRLKDLSRELAAQSTTASEGDVYSVIIGLRDLIKTHLNRSNKVVIEGIGSFQINLSSEGAETEEKFHQGLIKKAKVLYKEDAEMKDFTKTIKFEKEQSK